MKRAARLGVDVGGVIIGADNDTTMFTKNYLDAKPVAGAFEALAILRERFLGQMYIVSKAGPEMQEKTQKWFLHHDFYGKVGMSAGDVFFCRERADKAPICKRLSVTHFIDDRADVLSYLVPLKIKTYWFGQARVLSMPGIRCVKTWDDVLETVWP